MQLTIYCPDRHLQYDGTTPDRHGVGGGITARIRIAAALAARGNSVSVICNCAKPRTVEGVVYTPLNLAPKIQCDVLILHSSGGGLDLTPLRSIMVTARIRVVALSGTELPL